MSGNSVVGGGVVTANPGPSWKAIGTGDFNDDGHSDSLWQNADGQVSVWEMNGNTLIGGGAVSPNPGPAWKALGTGDLNEDRHPFPEHQHWPGLDLGDEREQVGWWWACQRQSRAKLACDWGGSDILLQNASGQISIWEMSGTNIVGGGAVSANPGPSWRAAGLT